MNRGFDLNREILEKLKQKVHGLKTKGIMTFKHAEPLERAESIALALRWSRRKVLMESKRGLRSKQARVELPVCPDVGEI